MKKTNHCCFLNSSKEIVDKKLWVKNMQRQKKKMGTGFSLTPNLLLTVEIKVYTLLLPELKICVNIYHIS